MGLFGLGKPNIEKMLARRDVRGLIKAMQHEDQKIKLKALDAIIILRSTGDKEAVEPLISALNDRDRDVRAIAAEMLGHIIDRRVVKPLVVALNDEDERVRASAAYALSIGGKKAIKPLLFAASMDESAHVRSYATSALREIGAPALLAIAKHIAGLINALVHADAEVRTNAVKVLRRMGWRPTSSEEKARFRIATGRWKDVVKIGEPAVEPLISALGSKYEDDLRTKAAKALSTIGKPAVDLLIEALGRKDKGIRMKVSWILSQIRDERAIKPLKKLLDDKNKDVRKTAKETLEKLEEMGISNLLEKERLVVYRETKPGIVDPLREGVADIGVKSLLLKFQILKTSKTAFNFLKLIDKFIVGFDDDCLSAVVGVIYYAPDDKTDRGFKKWAFNELFDPLLPGTWDLSYKGETSLKGFLNDFRLYKEVKTNPFPPKK